MENKVVAIVFVAFSLILANCSNVQKGSGRIQDKLTILFRSPGEKLLGLPNDVWQEQDCGNQKLPYHVVEKYQVLPSILKPGESVNQRLLYSLCSNKRSDEIVGTLYARVSFRGNIVINEKKPDYSMKPGRWLVDIFFDLPTKAKNGVYSIELEFRSYRLRFTEQTNFVVEE